MGVTASVFCLDCRELAPRIGDCGALGFPSLKNTAATITGDYHTFGYLQKGFDAIGYRPWDLEAIAAYLRAHKGHDVSLYLEGQDVRYDGDEDEDDEDDDDEEEGDDDEDEEGDDDDVSATTEFVFDDEDFVEGLFEVACEKCGVSVRTATERLRAFEPFTLKPAAIRAFMTRVRTADGSNFHRVFGLLDYYGEQERLASFLTEHASHRPKVRIVHEDSSHVKPGRALPWTLAWQQPGPFRADREPLVAADRVFVVSEPWVSGDFEASPAMRCYNLDGDELWTCDLPSGVNVRPELTSEGLVVQVHVDETESYVMLCLDPANGVILSSRSTPRPLGAWLPGYRAFLSHRLVSDPALHHYVAVVEWPTLGLRWEWPGPGVQIKDLTWRPMFATEDAVLLAGGAGNWRSPWVRCLDAATGRERWTTSLKELGDMGETLLWRDWFLAGVDGKLRAIDLADGRVAWQLEANLWKMRESHDLLLGYNYVDFVAVDLKERMLRFATPRKQLAATPRLMSDYSSVVAGAEILVVDQSARTLWGLDASSGRPVWKHRPKAGVTGQYPVVSGDRLIIQGPQGLYCYIRTAGS